MTSKERYELLETVRRWPVEDQLRIAEDILRNLRVDRFTDHELHEQQWQEALADPGFQRVLRNEDLPYPEPRPAEEQRRNEAG